MYGWLVCGCVGSLARLSISRKTNALMLRDGNLAVMLPRRTAVALLALCGLIAVGDGESGVCVCHLSVCIYLFDRLLVCGERVWPGCAVLDGAAWLSSWRCVWGL